MEQVHGHELEPDLRTYKCQGYERKYIKAEESQTSLCF